MDAVFISELFIMSYLDEVPNDAKLSQPWLENSVLLYLLLLESQLPFFVIEELFNEALSPDRCGGLPSFLELTLACFEYYDRQKLEPDSIVGIYHFTDLLRLFYLKRKTSESKPKPKHFSDLLRWFCLKRKTSERKPNPQVEDVVEDGNHILSYSANAMEEADVTLKDCESKCLLDVKYLLRWFCLKRKTSERKPNPQVEDGNHILSYSANALKEADVTLKDCESKCLLDVKFSGHILEIPRIVVDDDAEFLFRNMIALEQRHYPEDAYITEYALLLDWLINTEKDVDLLLR
ncbi:uncharacterized protein LOC114760626 [Neltuma alba]|uniref:uncharacterized protein LOC114760626 n=1 Tax=Neltuma alba TaxID=207710 RepID=UPI0010A495C1|nr:uncharacterized protein LOC114760626 [Prosopis alba]